MVTRNIQKRAHVEYTTIQAVLFTSFTHTQMLLKFMSYKTGFFPVFQYIITTIKLTLFTDFEY